MWEGFCDFTMSFGDYSDGSILKVLSYEFSEAKLQLTISSGALRDELAGSGSSLQSIGIIIGMAMGDHPWLKCNMV